MDEALREIGETPEEIATEIMEGSAAVAILSVAETRNNDLIVIGSRGQDQLAGLLLAAKARR